MSITIEPIGIIRSERKEALDDDWSSVNSWIELNSNIPQESILGLDAFSHIEILFYFHKADKNKIIFKAEHPRENQKWPKVGIFAQRKKARPNLIGATIAKIVKIENKKIFIKNMDAIDGTPVIDIKPVFKQYLPAEDVVQPTWVDELMEKYW